MLADLFSDIRHIPLMMPMNLLREGINLLIDNNVPITAVIKLARASLITRGTCRRF
jgi:hypothetical protein